MLEQYKINSSYSVKEAIQRMEDYGIPVVFILGDNEILEGIFTLGDMRKFILQNGTLTVSIQEAMNPNPVLFSSLKEAEKAKEEKKMQVYPIVDQKHRLIDALFERDWDGHDSEKVINDSLADVPLVIMAGGKGTRLHPYTKVLPKALIPIGDLTITERIINRFAQYGCKDVFLILNHKSNMIKSYFNELETDYKVHYIEENTFLGTGGGLQLLKGKIQSTFILSNCDVLINDDLECIYRTHVMKKNKITFVCAMKSLPISYGVVETDTDGNIIRLKEKPEVSFLTNTGVYVIEPEVIDQIASGEYIDFPDIAQRCINEGSTVGVFPVSEKSWLDMGKFNEMEEMTKRLKLRGEI